MNILSTFNQNSQTIFYFLLQFEIQIALLVALALCIDHFFLKNSSPKIRYALWLLVLIKSCIPPFLEYSVAESFTQSPAAIPFIIVTPNALTASDNAFIANSRFPISWETLLLMISLLPVLFLFGLFIAKTIRMGKIIRSAQHLDREFSEDLVRDLRRRTTFLTTDKLQSPVALGIISPKILLPEYLLRAPNESLRAVLLHEIAHLLRKDSLVLILQSISQILHAINPMIWLMNAKLNHYREQVCDEYALAHSHASPDSYGEVLLECASRLHRRAPFMGANACFFESKNGLRERIQFIISRKDNTMTMISIKQKLLLAVIALLLIPTAWQCKEESQPVDSNELKFQELQAISSYDTPPKLESWKEINKLYDLLRGNPKLNSKIECRLRIDAEGTVKSAVINSDDAAVNERLSAVMLATTWTPATLDGNSIASEIILPIDFRHEEIPSTTAKNADAEPEIIGGPSALAKAIHYPELAVKGGIQGTVFVKVKILASGENGGVWIEKGADKILDDAALEAVKKLRWKPGYRNGEALDGVEIVLPVKFKLQ